MVPRRVAVIGASADRRKYGNKALRAFKAGGYEVFAVNPHETAIEGLPTYRSVRDIPGTIDMATMYVPPAVGESIVDDLAARGVGELWLNPGSESPALVARARALGLNVIEACSVMGIGDSSGRY